MKRSKKHRGSTQARLTTAVTTSAMSITLLGALQNELRAQNPPQGPPTSVQNNQPTDEQAANKFFNFGYNYCDAKVLASFWNQREPFEAKVTMGHKLWNLDEKTVDEMVREARSAALQKADDQLPVWYTDGGYTYEDVDALARYWGEADSYESKITMGRLLIGGHDKVIKAALKSARNP